MIYSEESLILPNNFLCSCVKRAVIILGDNDLRSPFQHIAFFIVHSKIY